MLTKSFHLSVLSSQFYTNYTNDKHFHWSKEFLFNLFVSFFNVLFMFTEICKIRF